MPCAYNYNYVYTLAVLRRILKYSVPTLGSEGASNQAVSRAVEKETELRHVRIDSVKLKAKRNGRLEGVCMIE